MFCCCSSLYIILGLCAAIYCYLRYHYGHWARRNIFCEQPRMLFGNTSGKGLFWDINQLYAKHKHKTPFFGMFIMTRPHLVITDLELLKHIIIKDFDYFQSRGNFSNTKANPLSGHLLNLEGEHWKSLRSKLTPTFSSGKMKYMFSTVVAVGDRLTATLQDYVVKDGRSGSIEIELKALMSRYTIDVIGTTAFGIECNSLKDPSSEFNRIGNSIFNIKADVRQLLIRLNLFNLSTLLNLKTMDQSTIDFFKNLVRQTITYREENNIKRKDFMDLLIELKNSPNGITFNDVLAQCFVFFAAGYETSSSTMTYTLYELAQNQAIQDRLRTEINTVLEKYKGELCYDALTEMTYLEQVICESLRLHTPAPVVFRVAERDYPVPDTDYVIEKGTRVVLAYGDIHLDDRYYPQPEKFDPERFNAQNSRERHTMTYLPFGDGPRNCIGMRFGKIESKVGLVQLLRNFKFSNAGKTEVPIKRSWASAVVVQPTNLWLKVTTIEK